MPSPQHEMNLYRRYFDLVAAERKTIEVRVQYPKLRKLKAGDHIRFVCGRDDVLTRAMYVAQLGDTARTVFPGRETIGHVAPGRVVVLADRDDRIGRRVGLLRRMLDGGTPPHTRVWIEGLPDSDEAAGRLLDELTRA